MQRNLYLICVLLLLGGGAVMAQTNAEAAIDAYRRGETAMLQRDYRQAVRLFERAVNLQPDMLLARHAAATAHELVGNYYRSALLFAELIAADSLFSRVAYFKAGHNFYRSNRPAQAVPYYEGFEVMQARPLGDFGLPAEKEANLEPDLLAGLGNSIRAAQILADSVKFINLTEVINLGKGINGPANDYFPFLTNDRQTLYFTRQTDAAGDEDLFVSQARPRGWSDAVSIRNFNTEAPEGMSTLVRDGRRIFFTACQRDTSRQDCDIWFALADGNTIEQAEAVGAPLNTEYWESQAAVSCDGRTLIFASKRPGGFGGSDLYQSARQPDGRWGKPRNLGPAVNTPEDEEAPFISNDNQTLFFSSDGHPGLGEQDIFMCWWDDGQAKWSQAINIGPPVNGPHRELGLHLTSDGRTGFFASNRPGGEGGMDIYTFELSEHLFGEPIAYVEGFVQDSILGTGIPTTVDINGRPLIETYPDGRFFLCVGADEVLDSRVTVEGFKPYHNQFVIPTWDNREHYQIVLSLQSEVSVLGDILTKGFTDSLFSEPKKPTRQIQQNIYFGFDKSELNVENRQDMQDFLDRIEGLQIKRVIIAGFADSTGSDVYNFRLSENRAKNVAIFLVQQGMMIDQIHIEGMGANRGDKERSEQARRVEIRLEVEE